MRLILTESVVHYSQQRRQGKGHRTKKGGLPFILIYMTMTTSRHLNGRKEQKSQPPIALTAHKSMTTSFLPGLTRNVIVTCLPHALSKQGFGRQRRPLVVKCPQCVVSWPISRDSLHDVRGGTADLCFQTLQWLESPARHGLRLLLRHDTCAQTKRDLVRFENLIFLSGHEPGVATTCRTQRRPQSWPCCHWKRVRGLLSE